jgi:hypothetical protein
MVHGSALGAANTSNITIYTENEENEWFTKNNILIQ